MEGTVIRFDNLVIVIYLYPVSYNISLDAVSERHPMAAKME